MKKNMSGHLNRKTRPAEIVTLYIEPNYKQTALAVFNQQSFGTRQYLPQVEPEPSGTHVDSVVLGEEETPSGSKIDRVQGSHCSCQ